jgi:hypothetical protein
MYVTRLLLFFGLTAVAAAQSQRPTGFSEIPWKTKMEEVKTTMLAREGISQMRQESGPTRLAFAGGTFGGKPAQVWGFDFSNDGLYRGAVVLKSCGERGKEFDEAKALISTRYGPPQTISKEGRHSKAIWKFPATLKEKEAIVIIVWNNPGGEGVHVTYRNEGMKSGGKGDEKEL